MKHLIFFVLLLNGIASQAQTDTPTVNLFPNPNSGIFQLQVTSPIQQKAQVNIVNLMGQSIQSDSIQLYQGNTQFRFDISNQPGGQYLVLLAGKNWTRNQKIALFPATPTRSDSIDIVHYDLSLNIRNLASKTISGTAVLSIDPKQVDSLTTIKLDLLKLAVTDVKVNNQSASFSQNDSELYVVVNRKNTPGQDSLIDVAITYNGQPVSDALWGGFYFSGDYAYNMGVGFESNPHNFGRCWFPCIDNFTDRATYTFHITTDTLFKGVCSGTRLPETTHLDGSTTWNWEMNQPIPTYLASVAVGKYEFIQYNFAGAQQTFPVLIAVVAADTAKAKASFTKLNSALQCFEQKYGAYPFERVGYVGVPFNAGAMEHAANIAYPNYAINGGTDYETLFAHELSHMWWGDLATCRTAEDMWLNEGWASFNEALFLECVYGKQAYINDIESKAVDVLLNAPRNDGAWYPVSGVPHNATYGTHVYKKGALMVHTLRTLMGDDAFFAATRAYLQTYRYTDVTTDRLMRSFQPFTSHDLNAFFKKWIYSPGHSDIVLSGYSNTNGQWHFSFKELNRLNTLTTAYLPFTFTAQLSNGNRVTRNLTLTNGEARFDTSFGATVYLTHYAINQNTEVQLASLSQWHSLANGGNTTLSNVLLSVNIQTAGNAGDSLKVTHHWTGPIDVNAKAQGIRISTERYWTVQHNSNTPAVVSAFLNYNGNPSYFLDADLIETTEDSLVLLYRANVNSPWQIHTDNTFQPGPSKTDKTGRFWVNQFKAGEYAFGYKDNSVVGLNEIRGNQQQASFLIVPNPAHAQHRINLVWEKLTPVSAITVYNAQGKVVLQLEVNKTLSNIELNTEGLTPGTYTVTAKFKGTIASQKLIIQ